MSIFDAIERALDEMKGGYIYPPRGRVTVIPIVMRMTERTGSEPKEDVPDAQTAEGDTSSWHKDPVYGVFHSADYVGSVKLDINGHAVYMDADDAKKLYAQLGPVLKRYKKEHQNDE